MKLKYIFFLLIFFINFSGCQQEPETQLTLKNKLTLFNFIEYNKKISKPYLFLLYFAGDNNGMNKYLNSNLDSITKGLNNFNNSKIAAFFDSDKDGAYLYEINPPANVFSSSAITDLSYSTPWILNNSANSGSYKTVAEFLKWANNRYADKKYTKILIVGSHGSGSYGQTFDSRSMCNDKSESNSYITTDQFAQGLREGGFSKENMLDILITDVCLCGQIEEAYEYKDCVKYLVNSPNEIPGSGIPYEEMMNSISNESTLEDIGKNIVKLYAEKYYRNTSYNRPLTLTCSNLENIAPMANLTSSLADFFITHKEYQKILASENNSYLKCDNEINDYFYFSYPCTYYQTNYAYAPFSYYYTFDYGYLTDKLYNYAIQNNISELAEICINIQEQMTKIIVSSWRGRIKGSDQEKLAGIYAHINSQLNYYGLSITGNSLMKISNNKIATNSKNPYLSTFAFNNDTTWGNLLRELYPDCF